MIFKPDRGMPAYYIFLVFFVLTVAFAFAHTSKRSADRAEVLYENAVRLKADGKVDEAVQEYLNALRTNRAILAYQDYGLIEDLKEHLESSFEANNKDPKLLEKLGFFYAVCYSDESQAIKYYQLLLEHLDDPNVKERTKLLISTLEASVKAVSRYQSQVAEQMRQERLLAWEEMDRAQRFAEEADLAHARASNLSQMYNDIEAKSALVPQLEDELKELNEEHDKANRLWHTLNDDLYLRRRRRLQDQIDEKNTQLSQARAELSSIQSEVAKLEKILEEQEKEEQESPFKSYQEYEPETSYTPEVKSYDSDEAQELNYLLQSVSGGGKLLEYDPFANVDPIDENNNPEELLQNEKNSEINETQGDDFFPNDELQSLIDNL